MKQRHKILQTLFCCIIAAGAFLHSGCAVTARENLADEVELHPIFTDNMVLQRDRPIHVYGTATPNRRVAVSLDQETKYVRANLFGKWNVSFPEMKAGGPHSLRVEGKNFTANLRNILIGDVWLCAGDDAMAKPLGAYMDVPSGDVIPEQSQIRLYQICEDALPIAQTVPIRKSGWMNCSAGHVYFFPAVALFAGLELAKRENIPVGLIQCTKKGSLPKDWLARSADSLLSHSESRNVRIQEYKHECLEFDRKRKDAENRIFDLEDTPEHPELIRMTDEKLSMHDWSRIHVPGFWENSILPDFNGMVAFRNPIYLPASWSGKDLVLELGCIDEVDRTYFNGIKIGETGRSRTGRSGFDKKPRKYRIPGKLVRSGNNLVTLFVSDFSGYGGLAGKEKIQIYPEGLENSAIPLEGSWYCKPVVQLPEQEDFSWNETTSAFNAMLYPFAGFSIRGVFLYFGNLSGNAQNMRRDLPVLIRDWRKLFGRDIPFYLVQPEGLHTRETKGGSHCASAEIREAIRLTAETTSKTEMAVLIDSRPQPSKHVQIAETAGKRLAALTQVTNEFQLASGPRIKKVERQGDSIRIIFARETGRLRPVDKLTGFDIAGKDGIFYTADAVLQGADTVLVRSSAIEEPHFVRYAWAPNPDGNLCNTAGFPASPFTTEPFFDNR